MVCLNLLEVMSFALGRLAHTTFLPASYNVTINDGGGYDLSSEEGPGLSEKELRKAEAG